MRLEINYVEKKKKTVEKNTHIETQQYVTKQFEEIKEEIKEYLETKENENTMIQNLWDTAKAVLKGKFTAIVLPQEIIKTSNNQPNLTLKATRERRANKNQSPQKEGNHKPEINEMEMKKTGEEIKLKAGSLKR